jgi:hypothetical protein
VSDISIDEEQESEQVQQERLNQPVSSDYIKIQGPQAFEFNFRQFINDLPYSFFYQRRKSLQPPPRCK